MVLGSQGPPTTEAFPTRHFEKINTIRRGTFRCLEPAQDPVVVSNFKAWLPSVTFNVATVPPSRSGCRKARILGSGGAPVKPIGQRRFLEDPMSRYWA